MSDGTLAAPELVQLGWTDELEAAFTTYSERGFLPARVVVEHRGGYYVRSELGDRLASARGRLRDDELWGGMPAVGDWVAVCDAPGERFAIEALLPRRTKVSRKTPWLKAEEHILVANVDTVLIVSGLDGDFNPRRLERYLIAAWDSGADPVIVLTKLDLLDDPDRLAEAALVAAAFPSSRSATSPARASRTYGRCSHLRRRSSYSAPQAPGSRRSRTGSPAAR